MRTLTDSAGVVTDTFDYDAFGNLIGRTGTTPNSYLYRGQQFDTDLGFYYQRARYYSPQRGRFMSADSFDGFPNEPRSLHKYLYAHADPVNQHDPTGFASLLADYPLLIKTLVIGTAAFSTIVAYNNLAAAVNCRIYQLAWLIPVAWVQGEIEKFLPKVKDCPVPVQQPQPSPSPTPPPIPKSEPTPTPENDEIFYRAMSDKEYLRLIAAGGSLSIRENRTELFVTRSLNYVSRLSQTDPRFPVVVEFKRSVGTEAALIAAGATHNSAYDMFPDKPHIDDVGANNPNYVQLKIERGALTFGLRQNTIGIFNQAQTGTPAYRRIR